MDFNFNKAIEIVTGKMESWAESVVSMMPNLFVALIVIVLFYLLARGARLVAKKLLNKFYAKDAINSLFSTIIYLVVLAIGLMVALNVLHLEQTVTSLLAGAGIIGLALGFAFQDISANFISGIFMAFRKPIKVGDIIETKNYMGVVEKIDLRVTILRTFQGLHVLIPNKEVFQTPVTNYTKTHERRIDLEVGVSYDADLEQVKEIALGAVNELPYLLPDKESNLFYKEFASSSINFVIQVWVKYPDEPGFLQARSDVIMSIKKAFDENGINIPFPIRTLNIEEPFPLKQA